MYVKIIANPGQRDALVRLLLAGESDISGCEIYVVNLAPSEPDAVWVTEVWRSEADHAASLKLPSVQQVMARARPLIASVGESIRLIPVGGKGPGGRLRTEN